MKKKDLKPLNAVIQVCDCGKVDAYKDDGHDCDQEEANQINKDMYDGF